MPFSYDMTLGFSAAIFGAEKEFELSHLETCEVCAGTGAKVGSKMRICSTCGGRGQVMRTEQTPFGMFSQVITYKSILWLALRLHFFFIISLLGFHLLFLYHFQLMTELVFFVQK